MPTTVELEPIKVAKYLQVALAQRQREQVKFIQNYGADSAVAKQNGGDIAELQEAVTSCTKQAAAAPHSTTRK